jgi:predicted HAD superfamily Cof-like phosphohydrolase
MEIELHLQNYLVQRNQTSLLKLITADKRKNKMNKMEQQIREFNERFNVPNGDPADPRFNELQLRINLILEEVQEFVFEAQWDRFDNAVHELIDILYVTFGALVSFGITDIQKYFDEIHAANLRKEGGAIREDRKILKPDGWVSADLSKLIQAQRDRAKYPHYEEDCMPQPEQKTLDEAQSISEEVEAMSESINESLREIADSLISPEIEIDGEKIVTEVKRGRGRPRKSV